MKRRWQLGEGPSARIWQVEVDGCVVTTTTGTVSAPGLGRKKDHGDEVEADYWVELASQRMEGMGYVQVEIVEAPKPKPPPERAPAPKPSMSSRSSDVLPSRFAVAYAELVERPTSESGWLRLVRDLYDNGEDALGGLLQRGLSAEIGTEQAADWQAWLRRHRKVLYGDVDRLAVQVSWGFGVPATVRVLTDTRPGAAARQRALLTALAQAPIFRFAFRIEIADLHDAAALDVLAGLPLLREVHVQHSHTSVPVSGDVAPIVSVVHG